MDFFIILKTIECRVEGAEPDWVRVLEMPAHHNMPWTVGDLVHVRPGFSPRIIELYGHVEMILTCDAGDAYFSTSDNTPPWADTAGRRTYNLGERVPFYSFYYLKRQR